MLKNKHIIRFFFVGLFIYIIATILIYHYFTIKEVVLKPAVIQSAHIAETYTKRIWDHNSNAIVKIKENQYQNLLQDKKFILFTQMSNDFLQNINVGVTIYDRAGQKILTNQEINIIDINECSEGAYLDKIFLYLDKYFLQNYIQDQAISEAFNGKTVHSLISHAVVLDKNNKKNNHSFFYSYIPIINSSAGKFSIEGVLEICIDITAQLDNLFFLKQRIFISFIVVFFLLLIIVVRNTNYAQRVIHKQFKTNAALEEAKTRAELESSSKTEFLANVSHELRTPLNAIIGFSEIILAETYGKLDNRQYKEYMGDINGSGKHLLSVINDILDFSKAAADKLTVDARELDLNKLAAASMRFVKPSADKAYLQLIKNFPREHVIIQADPKRLKQALLNILSNSVKFTPNKGSITLSIKKDTIKQLVYITVSDTGIGMSDQDIPKALSSFGQVDNSLSRKFEGTGLGLPLTKKLIELMGGKFNLTSVKGKGTTVIITFGYTEIIAL